MSTSMARLDRLAAILAEHSISHSEVAAALGVTQAAFSRKINGSRPVRINEANSICAFVSKRVGRRVSLSELFSAANDMVATGRRKRVA